MNFQRCSSNLNFLLTSSSFHPSFLAALNDKLLPLSFVEVVSLVLIRHQIGHALRLTLNLFAVNVFEYWEISFVACIIENTQLLLDESGTHLSCLKIS